MAFLIRPFFWYKSDAVWRFPSHDAAIKEGLHLVEFALVYLLLRAGFPGLSPFWLLTLPFVAAVADEVHQLFVPSRSSALIDLGKDAFGIVVAHVVKTAQSRKRAPRA